MRQYIKEIIKQLKNTSNLSLVIILLVLVVISSGASYAVLRGSAEVGSAQVIQTGSVKLELKEDYENISDNIKIMEDSDGLLTEGYTFSVKNIGDASAHYDLSLENITPSDYDGEVLNDDDIKIGIEVNNKEQGPFTLAQVNNVIESNNINKNEVIHYTLRVWLNKDNEEELNEKDGAKAFLKLKVDAQQREIGEESGSAPVNFGTDDWGTIVSAVQSGNTSVYNVGDTKEIDMGTYGTHTVRIANKSTPSECNGTDFSQTACGFVIEFADIITTYQMNDGTGTQTSTISQNNVEPKLLTVPSIIDPIIRPDPEFPDIPPDPEFPDIPPVNPDDPTPVDPDPPMPSMGTNVGGWPASQMRPFVDGDIYNALPTELQNAIIDTKVVSGHGSSDSSNFTSTDKLYLLSSHEVWRDGTSNTVSTYDIAYNNTRQLDYYASLNVTTNNYSAAIKKLNGSAKYWWLRAARSSIDRYFLSVGDTGDWSYTLADATSGVSPAFRLG